MDLTLISDQLIDHLDIVSIWSLSRTSKKDYKCYNKYIFIIFKKLYNKYFPQSHLIKYYSDNIVISGSSILQVIFNEKWEGSDIDVYANDKSRIIFNNKLVDDKNILMFNYGVAYGNLYKEHIIVKNNEGNKILEIMHGCDSNNNIINDFDFNFCKNKWNFKSLTIYDPKNTFFKIHESTYIYGNYSNLELSKTKHLRLYKYITRGFKFKINYINFPDDIKNKHDDILYLENFLSNNGYLHKISFNYYDNVDKPTTHHIYDHPRDDHNEHNYYDDDVILDDLYELFINFDDEDDIFSTDLSLFDNNNVKVIN